MNQLQVLPNQSAIIQKLQEHGVAFAAVFGSSVRGTAKKTSDLDLLIEFSKNKQYSLFDLVQMRDALTHIVQKPVDLVTTNSLHPYIRSSVLQTMKVLYDQRER